MKKSSESCPTVKLAVPSPPKPRDVDTLIREACRTFSRLCMYALRRSPQQHINHLAKRPDIIVKSCWIHLTLFALWPNLTAGLENQPEDLVHVPILLSPLICYYPSLCVKRVH